jgi:hypothetical protein
MAPNSPNWASTSEQEMKSSTAHIEQADKLVVADKPAKLGVDNDRFGCGNRLCKNGPLP